MTVRLASALSDQPPSWSAEHLYFPLSLGTSLLITILPFANTETRPSCLIGSPPLSHDIFDGGFEVALQFSIALSSSFSVWLWGLTVIWGCSENNVTSMFLREIDHKQYNTIEEYSKAPQESSTLHVHHNQGFWYFVRSQSRKFQVILWNLSKFTKTHKILQNLQAILPNHVNTT